MPSLDDSMIGPALPFFYVSSRDGERYWLLAGPYPSEELARAKVETVRKIAYAKEPKSYFYSFGTCGTPDERKTPLGKDF
jgi:hypothetical protein